MKKIWIWAILFCLTVNLWAFNVERAKDSTVLIAAEAGGMGSGVCIDPRGYILTAAHVIEAWLENGGRCFVMFPDKPKWYTAEIVYYQGDIDVALLKINSPDAHESVGLWSSQAVKPGDALYTIGHPAGITWLLSNGIVSAVKYAEGGEQYIFGTPTVFFGNSGGAVFNEDTEIVGIVQSMYAGFAIMLSTDWLEEMIAGMIVAHEYLLQRRAILAAAERAFQEENKDLIEEWKKAEEEAKKAEEERQKEAKKKKTAEEARPRPR
jgi:hypothetical protein